MKKFFHSIICLLGIGCANLVLGAEVEPFTVLKQLPDAGTSTYGTLSTGVYRVSSTRTKTASLGYNGLSIAENSTVAIFIPQGGDFYPRGW